MVETQVSNVQERRLANGATLLFKHVPGAPRMALSFFIPGGNQLDPVPGLSDLIDRLMMKGTQSRSQEALSIEIDSLTLEVDTDTKRDYSIVCATLLEEDLDASLELIADLFLHSTLEEFEREKEKFAGEIQMDLDSPRSRASDLFVRTLFEDTCYSVVGTVILENLDKMPSLEDVQRHYHQVYRPDRLVISGAGDYPNLEELVEKLEQYFPDTGASGAATGTAVGQILKNLSLRENRVVTLAQEEVNQAHLYKGWYAPDGRHPDYAPLVVLNTILGAAGLSSRLFLELRDKQGLAYTVRSSYDVFKHRGMFYLYIGTEPSNKDKCLKGFEEECQKLMDIPVSAQELAEAKENILGRRSVFLETAPQQANYIGANYVMGRSLKEIEAVPSLIKAVTAEDVQRVARTYLSQPAVIAIVGPSEIL